MVLFWSSASSSPSPKPEATQTSSAQPADACPVDPKARSVWLQQHEQQKQQKTDSGDACPVDPKARSTWWNANARLSQETPTAVTNPENGWRSSLVNAFGGTPTAACSSDTISQDPQSAKSSQSARSSLSQEREVSSIPRAFPTSSSTGSSNAETYAPETSQSGNWIYPSETQFFQAVMRKNHNTPNTTPESVAESVSSIIPIHNAVNEKAWKEIQEWEGKYSPSRPNFGRFNPRSCPPKLLSFRGSGAGPEHDVETPSGLVMSYVSLLDPRTPLSLKARWNSFLGYQTPFDRHDWIVERCDGKQVEYVIDFYQGKEGKPRKNGGRNLHFYLDVRPKIFTVEGGRMHWSKAFGEEADYVYRYK